uniref:Uncharacterized protein n=1 Tax=candidate division WOR-3 bacterium TaxID=2052148 RepID=A0A7C4U7R0_UNCW3
MKINLPLEFLFALGMLLLTISLFIYASIIKRLLVLIEKKGIWIMCILAGLVLLFGTFIHFYRVNYFGKLLSHVDPEDLFPLILQMLKFTSIESWVILAAGIISLIGSGVYFRWISR